MGERRRLLLISLFASAASSSQEFSLRIPCAANDHYAARKPSLRVPTRCWRALWSLLVTWHVLFPSIFSSHFEAPTTGRALAPRKRERVAETRSASPARAESSSFLGPLLPRWVIFSSSILGISTPATSEYPRGCPGVLEGAVGGCLLFARKGQIRMVLPSINI